jgi:tRNA-specific 2-thiouridylase
MKCIALFSGGLDSMLAIKLVKEQNIEVEALTINIGFNAKDRTIFLNRIANDLDVKLTIIDDTSNYIQNILFNPKYGYGKNFNPCVDCHANFIKIAWKYAQDNDAQFLISGEVLNQRGMSQSTNQLKNVNKLCEIEDYIVRPLSAKLLPITKPEELGWIDRNELLSINGKSRKIQLELVKKYNITEFESPGSGCLLTDKNFVNKLKIYSSKYKLDINHLQLVKNGRLFVIDGYLLFVSKNKEENLIYNNIISNKFDFINTHIIKSPFGFISKDAPDNIKNIAASIVLNYAKCDFDIFYSVKVNDKYFSVKKCNDNLKYLVK